MLTIKAHNAKAFNNFYDKMVEIGISQHKKNKTIYGEVIVEKVLITFYKNLTIFFNNEITSKIRSHFKLLVDEEFYIGVDEVGVGENIGPFVVCAVKFRNLEDKLKTLELGIKDSKKLTHHEINAIIPNLLKLVEHRCVLLKPETFNKKWIEIQNVKKINALVQNQLINSLYEENYKPVLDQFVGKGKYYEYLKYKHKKYGHNILLSIKAEDKFLEVACASIIAKYVYNKWLLNYFEKNNIKIELGKKVNANHIFAEIKEGNIRVNEKELLKEWAKS